MKLSWLNDKWKNLKKPKFRKSHLEMHHVTISSAVSMLKNSSVDFRKD